jgi:predicted O-methyltransferase YrrM
MVGPSLEDALELLQHTDPRELEARGFRLEPCDYYSPINSLVFLEQNEDLWATALAPRDIDWRLDHQMEVAQEVARHVLELADVPKTSPDPGEYCWNNNFWNNADALVQYGLLRSRKPRRIVEIGCGYSSLMMAKALLRNEQESPGHQPEVTMMEPNPRREIMSALPHNWTLIETILQRAPLAIFEALDRGDLVFYDGSHCSRVASDVNWFFFEVLPRLKPGILIHVHDIFFPRTYPREWLLDRRQSWNEQYVLQAFLMHNQAYQIEIVNAFLAHFRPNELKELYQGIQPFWGASFWMRKVD